MWSSAFPLHCCFPTTATSHIYTTASFIYQCSVISVWFMLQVSQVSNWNKMSFLPFWEYPFWEVQTKTHIISKFASSCRKTENLEWKQEWNNRNTLCCLFLVQQQGKMFRNLNDWFICSFNKSDMVLEHLPMSLLQSTTMGQILLWCNCGILRVPLGVSVGQCC